MGGLGFKNHINEKISKAMKGVGLLRKLQYFFLRLSLLSIYESIMRRYLDYGHILYDQPSNPTFSSKTESVQYHVALDITGAISRSTRDLTYFTKFSQRKSQNASMNLFLRLDTLLKTLIYSFLFLAGLSTFDNSFFPCVING